MRQAGAGGGVPDLLGPAAGASGSQVRPVRSANTGRNTLWALHRIEAALRRDTGGVCLWWPGQRGDRASQVPYRTGSGADLVRLAQSSDCTLPVCLARARRSARSGTAHAAGARTPGRARLQPGAGAGAAAGTPASVAFGPARSTPDTPHTTTGRPLAARPCRECSTRIQRQPSARWPAPGSRGRRDDNRRHTQRTGAQPEGGGGGERHQLGARTHACTDGA